MPRPARVKNGVEDVPTANPPDIAVVDAISSLIIMSAVFVAVECRYVIIIHLPISTRVSANQAQGFPANESAAFPFPKFTALSSIAFSAVNKLCSVPIEQDGSIYTYIEIVVCGLVQFPALILMPAIFIYWPAPLKL